MDYKKVPQQINDVVGDNVKKLAQLFPAAVKDGEVDFETLKEELGSFTEVGAEKYPMNLPDEGRNRLLVYMDFMSVKNKLDKVALYKEWYSKAYILANEKAYEQTQLILDGNFWYDSDRTARVVGKYVELVNARASLKKATTNADRMKVNKLIKTAIADLNSEEL